MIRPAPSLPADAGLSQAQREILAHFNVLADEYQETAMAMMRNLARRFPRERARLALVGSQSGGAA